MFVEASLRGCAAFSRSNPVNFEYFLDCFVAKSAPRNDDNRITRHRLHNEIERIYLN